MAAIFFGEPQGVNVGDIYPSRKALIKANLHRSTMHGIDGNGNDGVAAIVISGGYEDDIERYLDADVDFPLGDKKPINKESFEYYLNNICLKTDGLIIICKGAKYVTSNMGA